MNHFIGCTTASWSGTYRGRSIAMRRHYSEWQMLVDGRPEGNFTIVGQEARVAWLERRVDELIAEAIFPGLRIERTAGGSLNRH